MTIQPPLPDVALPGNWCYQCWAPRTWSNGYQHRHHDAPHPATLTVTAELIAASICDSAMLPDDLAAWTPGHAGVATTIAAELTRWAETAESLIAQRQAAEQ